MQPLLISHFSVINSLGLGLAATRRALHEGRSGLAPCRFETVEIDTYIGEVAGVDTHPINAIHPELADYDCRNNRLAQMALQQDDFSAHVQAAIARYGNDRVGVFLGTSTSGMLTTELAYRQRDTVTGELPAWFDYQKTHNTYSLADYVRRSLGIAGPATVVSVACASSAKVFGNAARMIAARMIDAAVVGGVDSLCLTTLYGFRSLELTSTQPCRPFDAERDGLSVGEAAAFALIERAPAQLHGDDLLLIGIGESSDAHHISSPHPEGLGARSAMESALKSAGLQAQDIDYINLHGTATRNNDEAESKAIAAVFGDATACSSTKGATGHTLGAAGSVEAVISLIALQDGLMPGGLNTQALDPAMQIDYLLQNRSMSVRRVLSNSFGFGGANCSLIFGRAA